MADTYSGSYCNLKNFETAKILCYAILARLKSPLGNSDIIIRY